MPEIKVEFTDESYDTLRFTYAELGYRLKEEQRHLDGNWLIFTNEPVPPPVVILPTSFHFVAGGSNANQKITAIEAFLSEVYP